jgi:O-antigen/teichoic acid export membrane protein
MSILFLLDIGHEFRARMLEREMDWRRLRTLEGIGVVSSTALSVGMAVAGMGVYALIVPTLVAGLPTIVDLFVIHKWRPTWKWDAVAYKSAWTYGLTRMASVLVIWTRQLLESSVLVKIAGFALVGIYGRALGLAAICCLKVPSMLTQSLFPLLTKLEPGSSSSSKASTLVFCSVAWPTFPVAVIFSVLAAPVINTLYGPRWSAAIPFVPWALAASAATALAQTGSILLVANLRQKKSFCIDVIALVGTTFSLLLLAPKDLRYYLIGVASFQSTALVIMLVWLCQTRAIDLQGITASVILPAADVGVTYVVMEFVRPYLGVSRIPGALCYGLLFSLAYLLLLRLTLERQCREFVRFFPGHTRLLRWLALETDAAVL